MPNSSKDHSGVVGGVLGGILGAALIGVLIALFMVLRSRKALRNEYGLLQQDRDAVLAQNMNEKAALQQELEQQRAQYQQYQMQTPQYTPHAQYPGVYYTPSPALPTGAPPQHSYPTEVSGQPRPVEMDTFRGASELSDETIPQKVDTVQETTKKAD